jgi:hypothetical protein
MGCGMYMTEIRLLSISQCRIGVITVLVVAIVLEQE